jgi:hypothetical protein
VKNVVERRKITNFSYFRSPKSDKMKLSLTLIFTKRCFRKMKQPFVRTKQPFIKMEQRLVILYLHLAITLRGIRGFLSAFQMTD